MDMSEEELLYLLNLLDNLDEDIHDELTQMYNDLADRKPLKPFSDKLFLFFKTNLISNPVTTTTILSFVQKNTEGVGNEIVERIYSDVLRNFALESDDIENVISLLSLIRFKSADVTNTVYAILKKLSDNQYKQYLKQVYISLVAHNREDLVEKFTAYIKHNEGSKEFELTPENMLEMCYLENQHWILKALQVYKQKLLDMRTATFKLNNFRKQILILALIDIVNNTETYDFPAVMNQLNNIFALLNSYSSNDSQLEYYVTEIYRELNVVKFCMENSCKLLSMNVFNQIIKQSALSVVSQMCNLSKIDRYKVTRMLSSNNDFLNKLIALNKRADSQSKESSWDLVTYNSYCATKGVIDFIINKTNAEVIDTNTDQLSEINHLINSCPKEDRLEMIENIYACLFLRYEYFSCDDHNKDISCGAHSDCSYFAHKKTKSLINRYTNSGFMCDSDIVLMILNTLKDCLTKINSEEIQIEYTTKYEHISKVIDDSIWKLQLVTYLTPEHVVSVPKLCVDYENYGNSSDEDEYADNSSQLKSRKRPRPKKRNACATSDSDPLMTVSTHSEVSIATPSTNVEFVSLMLATPSSLVALALHHNNFNRANQIIQMFDLADADVALEVKFTEQLGQLVNRIRTLSSYETPVKTVPSFSVLSTEVTSLVEGFLSTIYVPNSHETEELARRHPHLQLYDQSNSQLINVVDVLMSTGLKRDVTYGLINIIEKRLNDVQTLDIAPKKSNYVYFVRDITSIMFEILRQNTYNYPEGMCGVMNDCKIPLKHKDFVKMNQYSSELQKSCGEMFNVLSSSNASDMDKSIPSKHHQIYMNIVTIADKDICNISTLLSNKKSRIPYLRTCYIYAKNISNFEAEVENVSAIENAPTEHVYFNVLNKHIHDIVADLIFEKECPINTLEPLCKKLNINLVNKLVLNFCPMIPLKQSNLEACEEYFNALIQLVYDAPLKEEELFIEPSAEFAKLPRALEIRFSHLDTYVLIHNWVLAYLLRKVHSETADFVMHNTFDSRTQSLSNFLDLERFNILKVLYSGNNYLSALHPSVDIDALFNFIPKLIETGKLLKCLSILDALPEQQLRRSANLQNLRDLVLIKLAVHPSVEDNWRYCQHISCPELKINLVLNQLSSWSAEGAITVLNCVKYMTDADFEDDIQPKCTEWIKSIPIYEEITKILPKTSWYDIYLKSVNAPEEIVELLMDSQQFKLCLDWAELHDVSNNMINLVISNLLKQLIDYPNQATPETMHNLLKRLPLSQSLDIIKQDITKVHDIDILQVIINFVTDNSLEWKNFDNIKIGYLIISEIEFKARYLFWDIVDKPLVMLEQLLMNGKLDKLSQILDKINPFLLNDPEGNCLYYTMKIINKLVISRNAVDALLRVYAEKSLDLKSYKTLKVVPMKTIDEKLLQSIDSINLESTGPFVMPVVVPSKEEWVKDYSVDCCMVCRVAIFSLIIRRHHCRRCGRVVCHACSRNKITIPTYPEGVKLRVCDDCFTQTLKKQSGSASDPNVLISSHSESIASGSSGLDWCLTSNPKRNQEIREEFSYEFTPNVNLCLTIMKLHSINLEYPRFLQKCSDEVWSAVNESNTGGGAGAVRLLVRARRWLLLAAAELYSRLQQCVGPEEMAQAESGAAANARSIAHANAAASLVRHYRLLPNSSSSAPYSSGNDTKPTSKKFREEIGEEKKHFVRHLLEAEKWELALEIATKAGVPRSSVLAAWGKACLKAGCYKTAREKFAHCFKSSVQHALKQEEFEECEFGKEASELSTITRTISRHRLSDRSSSMSSVQSESFRPKSNPPLLNEIIEILEDLNYPISSQLINKAESIQATNDKLASTNTSKKKIPLQEPALNIMHTLSTINKLKNADFSDFLLQNQTQKKTRNILRRTLSHNDPEKTVYKKLDQFFFKESVYYLTNYGSHTSNIQFLLKHSSLKEVLRYCYDNLVERDAFTECVYLECLKNNCVDDMVKAMYKLDSTLEMWTDYITWTCRWLQNNSKLEHLYALQSATSQHARAFATAARLYARPYLKSQYAGAPLTGVLVSRAHLLASGRAHLMQCTPCDVPRISNHKSLNLQLDKATIDEHQNTITRQLELTNYLAQCEHAGRLTETVLKHIMPNNGNEKSSEKELRPLTLFGSSTDKMRLAALVLVVGETLDGAFLITQRIIKESKLDSMKVYSNAVRYLIQVDRFMDVQELCRIMRTYEGSSVSDRILEVAVNAVVTSFETRGRLYDEIAELFIEDIQSISIKISCYIECKILKAAYILAAKHERTNELKKILREAERLGQEQVRSACIKRLARKSAS